MAARATAARGADEGKIRAIATAAQGDFKRITRATAVKDNSKGKAAAAVAETDNFGPETPGLSFGGGGDCRQGAYNPPAGGGTHQLQNLQGAAMPTLHQECPSVRAVFCCILVIHHT